MAASNVIAEVREVKSIAEQLAAAVGQAKVHAELDKYRTAQETELAQLTLWSMASAQHAAVTERQAQLRKLLSKPLRLSPGAVAVSAKTNEGFEELQRMILDAAFDKEAFPTFGNSQPGSYSQIHQQLLQAAAAPNALGSQGRAPELDDVSERLGLFNGEDVPAEDPEVR